MTSQDSINEEDFDILSFHGSDNDMMLSESELHLSDSEEERGILAGGFASGDPGRDSGTTADPNLAHMNNGLIDAIAISATTAMNRFMPLDEGIAEDTRSSEEVNGADTTICNNDYPPSYSGDTPEPHDTIGSAAGLATELQPSKLVALDALLDTPDAMLGPIWEPSTPRRYWERIHQTIYGTPGMKVVCSGDYTPLVGSYLRRLHSGYGNVTIYWHDLATGRCSRLPAIPGRKGQGDTQVGAVTRIRFWSQKSLGGDSGQVAERTRAAADSSDFMVTLPDVTVPHRHLFLPEKQYRLSHHRFLSISKMDDSMRSPVGSPSYFDLLWKAGNPPKRLRYSSLDTPERRLWALIPSLVAALSTLLVISALTAGIGYLLYNSYLSYSSESLAVPDEAPSFSAVPVTPCSRPPRNEIELRKPGEISGILTPMAFQLNALFQKIWEQTRLLLEAHGMALGDWLSRQSKSLRSVWEHNGQVLRSSAGAVTDRTMAWTANFKQWTRNAYMPKADLQDLASHIAPSVSHWSHAMEEEGRHFIQEARSDVDNFIHRLDKVRSDFANAATAGFRATTKATAGPNVGTNHSA